MPPYATVVQVGLRAALALHVQDQVPADQQLLPPVRRLLGFGGAMADAWPLSWEWTSGVSTQRQVVLVGTKHLMCCAGGWLLCLALIWFTPPWSYRSLYRDSSQPVSVRKRKSFFSDFPMRREQLIRKKKRRGLQNGRSLGKEKLLMLNGTARWPLWYAPKALKKA